MTLKMSKNDKALFYYLGLTLLVLIVLGAVFGISSVKESFGRKNKNKNKNKWKNKNKNKWKNRWKMIKCCVKEAGLNPKDKKAIESRKDWCGTEVREGRFKSKC